MPSCAVVASVQNVSVAPPDMNEQHMLFDGSAVQSDATAYRTHAKALAEVEPLVDQYRQQLHAEAQLVDAREMFASGDADEPGIAQHTCVIGHAVLPPQPKS